MLKDVSFHIEPGEKLAIVGATGSGKSTIIRLLARFYDFAPGQMFLDGIDLMDIPSARRAPPHRHRAAGLPRLLRQRSPTTSASAIRGFRASRSSARRALVHAHDFITRAAGRLRRTADRARPEPVARTAAVARVRARARGRPGNPGARRSHREHRHRNRTADSGRAARSPQGARRS